MFQNSISTFWAFWSWFSWLKLRDFNICFKWTTKLFQMTATTPPKVFRRFLKNEILLSRCQNNKSTKTSSFVKTRIHFFQAVSKWPQQLLPGFLRDAKKWKGVVSVPRLKIPRFWAFQSWFEILVNFLMWVANDLNICFRGLSTYVHRNESLLCRCQDHKYQDFGHLKYNPKYI